MTTVAVLSGRERRRRWTPSEKLRIVEESLAPEASVTEVAHRHDVHPNLLHLWRRQARTGVVRGERAAGTADRAVSFCGRHGRGGTSVGITGAGAWLDRDRVCLRRPAADQRRGGASDGSGGGRGCDRRAAMTIPVPTGVRVWLATGHTDMRKGFPSLALQVQEILRRDPLSGHLFCFRGRRGDLLKVIWHDGQGACLFTKRLERGRFLWPSPADGVVTISSAQLGYLLSGIDWRHPQETWRPTSVG